MVVAFIPVRCGSKSIPFKNIKPFCGQPLIYWTASAASKSNGIDDVVISTDCDQIEQVINGFGLPKVRVFRRSAENAMDTSSTESAMLEFLSASAYSPDTTFILIQATTPFIESKHLTEALTVYSSGQHESLLSCVKIKRFFWQNDGVPLNYDFRKRPRRQDFDGIFLENGAFYINSTANIVKNGNRLSGKVGVYEMPEYSATELDEPDDWIIAEHLMYKHVIKKEGRTVKLFASDVDGVLTDAGIFYGHGGEELKKFSVRDGMGFSLIKKRGVKTAFITSEQSEIVQRRAEKLKIDHVYMNQFGEGKLESLKKICAQENISLSEVAYIGDDINCIEALSAVGFAACPADAVNEVKMIPGITVLKNNGGNGVAREFIELLIKTCF